MPRTIQAPTGLKDVLPAEVARWHRVESIAREVAGRFNYKEIRTPMFEYTELFHRGVGEGSDIIRKETYTFQDRDGQSITLRPEGTAGVVRAMIEHGFFNDQGSTAKVYYLCQNFRHERPQAGRLRQHMQFGVEAFGVAGPEQDVECIQLQMAFYSACGLRDVSLTLNSLGDAKSKAKYRDMLVAFLSPKRDTLSEDSQRRLESNPLRILDSKDPRDKAAVQGAPAAAASLSDKSKAHFERVQELLSRANVPYVVSGDLVRGFDYYTETLWEVVASGLGAQSAVGGGGRYDGLVAELGGKPTPGVGFGSGIERLLIALEKQGVDEAISQRPLVWVAAQSAATREAAFEIVNDLRAAGIAVDTDLTGRAMKAQFKLAEKAAAAFMVILSDDDLATGNVALKNYATREQTSVPRAMLVESLRTVVNR